MVFEILTCKSVIGSASPTAYADGKISKSLKILFVIGGKKSNLLIFGIKNS